MQAVLLGLAAALIWGLHDFLVRLISPGANVLGQILTVTAVGVVILAVPGGRDLALLSPQALGLAVLSGIGYIVAYFCLYRAFALAPARVVSPILGAYPLLTMLVAALTGTEVPWNDWLAVVAVVAGIAVVAVLAEAEGHGNVRVGAALIWAGLSAAGFAATFALGQAASVGDLSLAAGLVTRVVALLGILTLVVLSRPSLQPVLQNWKALGVMGLLDTAALALVMLAGGWPNAEYASVAASLFGLVTILLAWWFLSEQVRLAQWLGLALVFAGIAWLAG